MEKSENNSGIYRRLFKEIQKHLAPSLALVDAIADTLHISTDAAYRRMSGKTLLDIEEASILCNHFHIPFDLSKGVKDVYSFNCVYRPVDVSIQGDYLSHALFLSQHFEELRSVSDSSILMSAIDIPLFHLVYHKELIFFKLYTWAHSVYGYRGSLDDFIKELDTPEFTRCHQKICDDYEFIPSAEIWTDHTLDTTTRLINYYLDMETFTSKEFPLLLCEGLWSILTKFQQWVEKGKKGNGDASFQFYLSEIDFEGTYALLKQPGQKLCVVRQFTINSLTILDEDYCTEADNYLSKLAQRSILLCGGSEKERIKFFNTQREKVQDLMGKINHSF